MKEWTKVSDGLPLKDGKCLVVVQRRISVGTFYKGHFYNLKAPIEHYKENLTIDKRYTKVTHWIEFPKLPEKE